MTGGIVGRATHPAVVAEIVIGCIIRCIRSAVIVADIVIRAVVRGVGSSAIVSDVVIGAVIGAAAHALAAAVVRAVTTA